MAVGAELAYEGEQILKGNVSEFTDYDGTILRRCSLPIHMGGENGVTHGMNDEGFIRGDVPMTKRKCDPSVFQNEDQKVGYYI